MMRIDSRFTQGREVFRRLNPTRYVEPGTLASPFVITRAQAAGVESAALGSDGVTWNTFGADTARFFDTSQALGMEPQVVNRVSNPRFEGFVAGNPGTVPANWPTFTGAHSGMQREIVGTGTVNGLPYVDIRYFGTPTATTGITISSNNTTTTVGSRINTSAFFALVGGSTDNIGSAILRNSAEAGTTPITLGPTLTRVFNSRVLTGTAQNLTIRITYAQINVPTDFTMRIAAPQSINLAVSLPFTPVLPPVGTPAASTRGVDNVSGPLTDFGIGDSGACTVLWAGSFFATNTGTQQTIVGIDDNTGNNRFELRIGQLGQPEGLIANNNVQTPFEVPLGFVPANSPIKAGMSVDGNGRLAIVYNGIGNNIAASAIGGVTSGMLTLRLGGSDTTAERSMIGQTNALYVSPTPLTDAELSAAVAAFTF
jgi:hypothetical protein